MLSYFRDSFSPCNVCFTYISCWYSFSTSLTIWLFLWMVVVQYRIALILKDVTIEAWNLCIINNFTAHRIVLSPIYRWMIEHILIVEGCWENPVQSGSFLEETGRQVYWQKINSDPAITLWGNQATMMYCRDELSWLMW